MASNGLRQAELNVCLIEISLNDVQSSLLVFRLMSTTTSSSPAGSTREFLFVSGWTTPVAEYATFGYHCLTLILYIVILSHPREELPKSVFGVTQLR